MALFGASTINESMTLSARTSQDASGERRGTGRIKYSWEGHHDPHQTVKCSAVRTQTRRDVLATLTSSGAGPGVMWLRGVTLVPSPVATPAAACPQWGGRSPEPHGSPIRKLLCGQLPFPGARR